MKYVLSLIMCLCHLSSMVGQEMRLIDQIKEHSEGVAVWWTGHNGWIIKSNDLVISTDILLDYDKRNKAPSITAIELAEVLDISFITHGHKDHFNRSTSKILADQSNCLFVIPASCKEIARDLDIPDERIIIAKPRENFDIKGISVQPLRAIHGNANFAIYYQANFEDCGYVLNIDGLRFLQPGDTYLLEDHLFLEDLDVLFFSPTEHNMYIDRSVILINTLEPKYIFPQHHSTVIINESTRFWAKAYIDEVKLRLPKMLKDRYYVLEQGQKMIIE